MGKKNKRGKKIGEMKISKDWRGRKEKMRE